MPETSPSESTRERQLAALRHTAVRARTLLDKAEMQALWIRTGPRPEDEEPTRLQRCIWSLYAELDHALSLGMPENDPWYEGAECAEIEKVLDRLKDLLYGKPGST